MKVNFEILFMMQVNIDTTSWLNATHKIKYRLMLFTNIDLKVQTLEHRKLRKL